MADLTPEQKDIIRTIETEATKAGLDPDFAISIANLESGFQNIPSSDKSSTAYGPFQVNKATAEANGFDYDAMKNSPTLAIQAGIKNLVRHATNPTFAGDPLRIAAAHRYGENSEFAQTGDQSKIDNTLRDYLASAMEHFPNESFPETIYTNPGDVSTQNAQSGQVNNDGMGSQPLAQTDLNKDQQESRQEAAMLGAGAGAMFGAVKAPVYELGKGAYGLLKGIGEKNITPKNLQDANDAIAKIKMLNAETPATDLNLTSGEKYTNTTGYGEGKGTVKNVVDRMNLAKPKSKIARKVYERQKAVESLSAAAADADRIAQQAAAIKQYEDWVRAQNAIAPNKPNFALDAANKTKNLFNTLMQSSPVRYGLAGMGTVYNLENADQQFGTGPVGNAAGTASLVGALASGLSAIPKLAARANPVAIGATTAGQVLSDINRGDYEGAKGSGYLGGLAFLNPLTAIGALIPSTLNKEEEQFLKNRNLLAPTIYSGTNAPRKP